MAVQDYLESMDFITLRKLILDMAPDDVDKSEGSFLYDAVTPIALFMSQIFSQMKLILEQSFIGTATGSNLDTIAATMPRLYRHPATAERLTLRLTPNLTSIYNYIMANQSTLRFTNAAGEPFRIHTEDPDWFVIDGNVFKVKVIKETTGKGTSVVAEAFEPATELEGLSVCQVDSIDAQGDTEEDDAHFRVRIWGAMSSPFLGTVSDYYKKIFTEFPVSENGFNVDSCIVIPRGSRSGYICVIPIKFDSDTSAALHCEAGELTSLQEYLDKRIDKVGGYGFGVAPIGHVVRVTDWHAFTMNFRVTVTIASGTSGQVQLSAAQESITRATDIYFKSIIDEVIPSFQDYRANAKRYVNFYIQYYLNAHEYAVQSSLKETFGNNVIKNVLIERRDEWEEPGEPPQIDYREQRDCTIMSGDSSGCLPVLGTLEVVIVEEA
jgi:hypothetical protein